MNTKPNQPHYTEAMKMAIADIIEACHKEGKCFIAYNSARTKNINIIIANFLSIQVDIEILQ